MSALVRATGLSLPGRLHDVTLELEGGSLCCLVGPNGSGKTSLLHALGGIGSPAGNVSIDGRDPHRLAPAERQHLLTFLPASRDIAWPLSASDLIQLGLPRPDDARVGELLATFDLEAMQSRRVDRLSTGERSRVLIARALAARPRLLLLDEPASNLDPLWQLKLMAGLAADVRGSEAAGLIAIHDLDLGARFADRLIVMDRGRIAADGPPASIMDSAVIAQVFGIERRDGRWHPAA